MGSAHKKKSVKKNFVDSAKRAIERARAKAASDTGTYDGRSEDFDDPMLGLDRDNNYRPEDGRDAQSTLAQDAKRGLRQLEDRTDDASSAKDQRTETT